MKTCIPSPSLSFVMPPEVLLVASAVYMGGEKYPTVELAIYERGYDPGDSDARLTGETELGPLKLRRFFPSSGCAVLIKNKQVHCAEPGLQYLRGKYVSTIKPGKGRNDVILVVWKDGHVTLSDDVNGNFRKRLITTLDGLSAAFT